MLSCILYLQHEIPKSTDVVDRAMVTAMMNPCYVNDKVAVENIVLQIQEGDYSEDLKVIAGWVLVLMSEPKMLDQLIKTDVVPLSTPRTQGTKR